MCLVRGGGQGAQSPETVRSSSSVGVSCCCTLLYTLTPGAVLLFGQEEGSQGPPFSSCTLYTQERDLEVGFVFFPTDSR